MRIIVCVPFNEEQKRKIELAAGTEDITFFDMEVPEEEVKEADIIMGNLSPKVISTAKHLKWLQLNSAGADAYCVPGVLKDSAILTNASGAYDISVSEGMVAGTMAMLRKLYTYHDNQKKNLWKDEGMVQSAYGARVVVLGLGKIGLEYARKMKAMGSYIIGVKRHISAVPEWVDELYTIDHLEECLKRADVVASVLPGTAQTVHLMGKEQFAAMKPTAYFLNAGRGNLVDQDALYDALESGQIAGAMLDVTEVEPLPADDRLWSAKNLYLTPHVTGGFHIPVTLDIISDIFAENLRSYLSGEKMRCVVNRSLGY